MLYSSFNGPGGPQLLHIDRKMTSDGPIVLSGGGPISVTLTEKGTNGYVIATQAFPTKD